MKAPKSKRKPTKAASKTVELVVIMDRSGSMESMKADAIGGFNAFLKGHQDSPGKARFTHVQFDGEYEVVCDGIDIKDAKPYTDKTYKPRGSTALLDAIGVTINTITNRQLSLPEAERSNVIFTIITDGEENDSKTFTSAHVQSLIKAKEKEGWNFIYLAHGLAETVCNAQLDLIFPTIMSYSGQPIRPSDHSEYTAKDSPDYREREIIREQDFPKSIEHLLKTSTRYRYGPEKYGKKA